MEVHSFLIANVIVSIRLIGQCHFLEHFLICNTTLKHSLLERHSVDIFLTLCMGVFSK